MLKWLIIFFFWTYDCAAISKHSFETVTMTLYLFKWIRNLLTDKIILLNCDNLSNFNHLTQLTGFGLNEDSNKFLNLRYFENWNEEIMSEFTFVLNFWPYNSWLGNIDQLAINLFDNRHKRLGKISKNLLLIFPLPSTVVDKKLVKSFLYR